MKLQCPVPDCTYKTEDLTDASLLSALLNLHATAHAKPAAAAETAHAPPKAPPRIRELKRSTISLAANSEDWAYFIIRWEEYRVGSRLDGPDVVLQLLECCTEELWKDLVRTAGRSLAKKSEKEVLQEIKKLAVLKENNMIARATLYNMRQQQHETIRSFSARIRGQANTCNFVHQCTSCNENVCYSEAILQDVLIRGIADQEILQNILSDPNQDRSYEDILALVEAKESARNYIAAMHSNNSESVNAVSKTNKRTKCQNAQTRPATCSYYGRKGHGKASSHHIRRTECPAYNQRCKFCLKNHHLESVCRKKQKVESNPDKNTYISEDTGAMSNGICSVSTAEDQPSSLGDQKRTGRRIGSGRIRTNKSTSILAHKRSKCHKAQDCMYLPESAENCNTLPTSTAERKPSSLGDQKKTERFGSGRIRTPKSKSMPAHKCSNVTKLMATCASLNQKTSSTHNQPPLTNLDHQCLIYHTCWMNHLMNMYMKWMYYRPINMASS